MATGKPIKNIAGRIREFAEPVVRELGYELWDVAFEKVGSLYELTVYIDAEKGIGIEDCEKVSRALDPLLDRYDPIPKLIRFMFLPPAWNVRLRFRNILKNLWDIRSRSNFIVQLMVQNSTAVFYAPMKTDALPLNAVEKNFLNRQIFPPSGCFIPERFQTYNDLKGGTVI